MQDILAKMQKFAFSQVFFVELLIKTQSKLKKLNRM